MTNPFTHARIVPNTNGAPPYQSQTNERGTPGFIMSRSQLMQFAHCPARWFAGYSASQTDAMKWGSIMDCLVLTPDLFDTRYVVTPETYPATPKKKGDPVVMKDWNRRATYCQDWEDEQVGKTVLTRKEYNLALLASGRLLRDPVIDQLIACSARQVLVEATYHDEATGLDIPFHGLLDLVPDAASESFGKLLGDFKTADSAAPGPWAKTVHFRDYHVQAALYLDLYIAATGEDRNTFAHIVQESYSPWQSAKRILAVEFIDLGRARYRAALERYCACLQTAQFPDYDVAESFWHGFRLTNPEPWMLNAA